MLEASIKMFDLSIQVYQLERKASWLERFALPHPDDHLAALVNFHKANCLSWFGDGKGAVAGYADYLKLNPGGENDDHSLDTYADQHNLEVWFNHNPALKPQGKGQGDGDGNGQANQTNSNSPVNPAIKRVTRLTRRCKRGRQCQTSISCNHGCCSWPVPALALMLYTLLRGYQLRAKARQAYGKKEQIEKFSDPLDLRTERWVMAGWLAVALGLVAIIAMPVSSKNPASIAQGSTQVVAVIDGSPSMLAEDHRSQFPPIKGVPPDMVLGPYGRRIDEVRIALEDRIMPALVGNELGIVLYEGDGKDQVDLDDNFQKIHFEFANHWIEVGQAPGDGSDYGKGLKTALSVFASTPEPKKDKVIILFSDGGHENLDEKNLDETVSAIRAQHIKVLIVGVGSEKEMKIPKYNAQGVAKEYLDLSACDDRDGEGNCQTKLDMKELNDLRKKFDTVPMKFSIGEKLPIHWATSIAGKKALDQPVHLYKFVLVPALLIALWLELCGLSSRGRNTKKSIKQKN